MMYVDCPLLYFPPFGNKTVKGKQEETLLCKEKNHRMQRGFSEESTFSLSIGFFQNIWEKFRTKVLILLFSWDS